MSNDDEDVGFGKPPRKSRFPKGKSGNPAGRPKGARNKPDPSRIDKILLAEGNRTVEVTADGQKVSMPTVQAIARSVNVSAIKGSPQSQRIALEMLAAASRREDERHQQNFANASEYKAKAAEQIAAAATARLPPPNFEIHPDNIHLDPTTGEVTVSNLKDEEWEAIQAFHNYRFGLLDDLEGYIEDFVSADISEIDFYKSEISLTVKHLRVVERILGGPFSKIGDGSLAGLNFNILKTLGEKR